MNWTYWKEGDEVLPGEYVVAIKYEFRGDTRTFTKRTTYMVGGWWDFRLRCGRSVYAYTKLPEAPPIKAGERLSIRSLDTSAWECMG